MPVSDLHPSYNDFVEKWTKCRDAFEGSDAIKDKGPTYLPRLTGQTDEEYKAYKTRALFYEITGKTASALVGMATTKEPTLTYPDEMKKYFEDQNGMQFTELWVNVLNDLILIGRIGALVDAPINGGDPYVTLYPAENIINWRTDEYDRLVMVVLYECFHVPDREDEFKSIKMEQYRVLRLIDGVYTVQIYTADEVPGKLIVPKFRGRELNYIPFYIANPFGLGSKLVKPPMLGIVDINISHYMSSADLEHGRHFTGLPTPVAIGVESSELHIGSMTAWTIPDPQGDAKYLEFTGQGLKSLETALKEKQEQLASLSARFIDNSARGSEAVDAVRLRHSSESASLSLNIEASEVFMQSIYRTIAVMMGLDESSVEIDMNKELMSNRLTGDEVKKLVEAYIAGGMSKETLVYNLRRGEIINPERNDVDEINAIKEPVEKTPQA